MVWGKIYRIKGQGCFIKDGPRGKFVPEVKTSESHPALRVGMVMRFRVLQLMWIFMSPMGHRPAAERGLEDQSRGTYLARQCEVLPSWFCLKITRPHGHTQAFPSKLSS